MSTPFFGYSGVVWQATYAGLSYYQQQLAASSAAASGTTSASAVDLVSMSQTMLTTLQNAAEAINANALLTAWNSELNSLQQIQALPLGLDVDTATIFNARVSAYQSAVVGVSGSIPQAPYGAPGNIASGMALIPDAGLLSYFESFSYETAPSGLTAANLVDEATAVATAFQTVANAVLVYQGLNVTQLYDTALRESLVAGVVAQTLAALTSGPFADDVSGLNTWNQIVTLPAMTMCADILNGAPFTQNNQQEAVIKYAMLTLANKIATYLLTQRRPLISQVQLTTLRVNESLMDVASRTLGNYERWTEIADLNGLLPPYVGAVSVAGIAGWGSKLILPTPGAANAAVGTPPSYTANFLGTDLYIGPINGDMPAWTGDFQTITGYANLAWALGRRIQTSISSLIYHPLYGSRIPPHVGNIQLNTTTAHIAAQGKSALLADPRVARVPIAVAKPLANSAIAFSATVQPNGLQSQTLTVNEVLSTLP